MRRTEQSEFCNVSLKWGMRLVWSADLPGAGARCTALLSTAHAISLAARTHAVSPLAAKAQYLTPVTTKKIFSTWGDIYQVVQNGAHTLINLIFFHGWVLPNAPSGQLQSSGVSLWQDGQDGGLAGGWHHLSTVALAKAKSLVGLKKTNFLVLYSHLT